MNFLYPAPAFIVIGFPSAAFPFTVKLVACCRSPPHPASRGRHLLLPRGLQGHRSRIPPTRTHLHRNRTRPNPIHCPLPAFACSSQLPSSTRHFCSNPTPCSTRAASSSWLAAALASFLRLSRACALRFPPCFFVTIWAVTSRRSRAGGNDTVTKGICHMQINKHSLWLIVFCRALAACCPPLPPTPATETIHSLVYFLLSASASSPPPPPPPSKGAPSPPPRPPQPQSLPPRPLLRGQLAAPAATVSAHVSTTHMRNISRKQRYCNLLNDSQQRNGQHAAAMRPRPVSRNEFKQDVGQGAGVVWQQQLRLQRRHV